MTRRLPSLRALVARLREQAGFGLIELLIAMTMLAIGFVSLTGVFVSSQGAIRRAAQQDTASVLADKMLEQYRALSWSNIALSSTLVSGADSIYTSDSALTGLTDITEANGAPNATNCAGANSTGTNVPVTCVPSRLIPDASRGETAPDHRNYRVDSYVTWGCPDSSETLAGTTASPSCTGAHSPSFAPVKIVTIVVRDDTSSTTLAGAPVYRSSTIFDRLGGGSMPTVTAIPTNAGTTSTTSTGTTTSGSGPAAPNSVSLVNGGGTGSAYINAGNATSVSVDVALPSSSAASDLVFLVVSDGNGADTQTFQASGTTGAGTVHFTGINAQGMADGTITISTYTQNSGGTSSTVSGTVTKDTVAPDAPTAVALQNGQGSGGTWINASNVSSVNASVTLDGNSKSSDTVSVTLGDGTNTTAAGTAAGSSGSGTVTTTGINASSLSDGTSTITASAKAVDSAGNASAATTATFSKDAVATAVSSINRVTATPTNNSPVSWTVTFNKSVTGVASSNFALVNGGLGGAPAITSVSGSGTTWTVTASTGSGSGTLGLNLTSVGSISDSHGNALTGTPVTGQVYTIDHVAPTVSSINRVSATPTNNASVSWTVTFSKSVTGVVAGNFSLVNGGLGGSPTITSVSGSGTTWTVTASTGSGSGTLGLNLSSVGSIQDAAGNALSGSFTGQVYTVDHGSPTIGSVQLVNNGTAGKIEKGDQIVITFSKTISVATFCSAWSGDGTNQTISGNGAVTVTMADGTGGTNDSLTLSSTACTFHFGSIDLGSNAYISGGGATFSGNGANASTIAWNAATHVLTITLGTKAGAGTVATVATSTAIYTPSASITDTSGNTVSGTGSTGNVKNF